MPKENYPSPVFQWQERTILLLSVSVKRELSFSCIRQGELSFSCTYDRVKKELPLSPESFNGNPILFVCLSREISLSSLVCHREERSLSYPVCQRQERYLSFPAWKFHERFLSFTVLSVRVKRDHYFLLFGIVKRDHFPHLFVSIKRNSYPLLSGIVKRDPNRRLSVSIKTDSFSQSVSREIPIPSFLSVTRGIPYNTVCQCQERSLSSPAC